jgi:DNA-binding PadR family transcriptional regulator
MRFQYAFTVCMVIPGGKTSGKWRTLSIRYGLLGLLSQAPTHGYQLRLEFEAATGETWPLNIGQVYSTLQRLERDGLVAGLDKDDGLGREDRRRYEVTGPGQAQLREWFARPVPRESPPRSELVIKLVLALVLPEVETRAVIDIQREATMRGLQTLIRAKAQRAGDLAASWVADAAIFNAEAEIRWLDQCEAGLLRPAKGVTS